MHVLPYYWRSSRKPQLLRVRLADASCDEDAMFTDGGALGWSMPFFLDVADQVVCAHDAPNMAPGFRVTAETRGVQSILTISGEVSIHCHIDRQLEIQFLLHHAPPPHHHHQQQQHEQQQQQTPPEVVRRVTRVMHRGWQIPALFVKPNRVHSVAVRRSGVDCQWSRDILLPLEQRKGVAGGSGGVTNSKGDHRRGHHDVRSVQPLEIPDEDGTTMRVWCYCLLESCGMSSHLVLIFCPLYIVRNHLAESVWAHCQYTRGDERLQQAPIKIPGQGKWTFLSCFGLTQGIKSISFMAGPNEAEAAPPIVLQEPDFSGVRFLESMSREDFALLLNPFVNKYQYTWPYVNSELLTFFQEAPSRMLWQVLEAEVKSPVGIIHRIPDMKEYSVCDTVADTQLEVNQSTLLNGPVIMDVRPWLLLVNESGRVVHFLCASQSWVLPHNGVATTPKSIGLFHLAIELNDNLVECCQTLYFPWEDSSDSVPSGCQQLSLDSTVNVIFINKHKKLYCSLVLRTFMSEECRILHVLPELMIHSKVDFPLTLDIQAGRWSDDTSVSFTLNPSEKRYVPECCTADDMVLILAERLQRPKRLLARLAVNNNTASYSALEELPLDDTRDGRYSFVVNNVFVDGVDTFIPILMTYHQRNGCMNWIFTVDSSPLLRVHNNTKYCLGISTADAKDIDRRHMVTIPAFGEIPYTPRAVNENYVSGGKMFLPPLHFALVSDSTTPFVWSSGVTLDDTVDQFITIHRLGDVRVRRKQRGICRYWTLECANRAEISAKEIRSRIGAVSVTNSPTIPTKRLSIDHQQSPPLTPSGVQLSVFDFAVVPPSPKRLLNVSIVSKLVSVVVYDASDVKEYKPVFALYVDDLLMALRPARGVVDLSRLEFIVSARNAEANNLMASVDFPVVFVGHTDDAFRVSAEIQMTAEGGVSIQHVRVIPKPVSIFLEDRLLVRLKELSTSFFLPSMSFSVADTLTAKEFPLEIQICHGSLVTPLNLCRIEIEDLSLNLSLHMSTKILLSIHHSPLRFSKLSCKSLFTSSYAFGRLLIHHYVSGALFKAGWMVGSLDLIGNPAGLVQAVGTGMADFVRLPYQGLFKGPWAFFLGMSHGTTSLVRQISAGTLSSITELATSVSRNLDKMSLDEDHFVLKESLRREPSANVVQGMAHGMTSLGLSVLGAIAGIVEHPMQAIISSEESPEDAVSMGGVISGVGKGILGVVTKPISGAAELVAQTGRGILHGTGWDRQLQPRQPVPDQINVWSLTPSAVKFGRFYADFKFLVKDGVGGDLIVVRDLDVVIWNEKEDTEKAMLSGATTTLKSLDPDGRITFVVQRFVEVDVGKEMMIAGGCSTRVAEYVLRESLNVSAAGDIGLSSDSKRGPHMYEIAVTVAPPWNESFIRHFASVQRKALAKGFPY